MFELIFLGSFVGLLSGFFGIGGGTILVPLLLMLGYKTKVAIGISVVTMVFGSVYGSYLNSKKGTLDVVMISFIGAGGFIGAMFSGFITSNVSNEILELFFLAFVLFALLRLFLKIKKYKKQIELNKVILFLIGVILGAVSLAVGVGGGLLLVPILAGFLHVPLKNAVSAGLFFVVFSSISGLLSHAMMGDIDYKSGIVIGLSSLIGVYIGIHLKDKADTVLQKKLLIGFYLLVVLYLIKRIFF